MLMWGQTNTDKGLWPLTMFTVTQTIQSTHNKTNNKTDNKTNVSSNKNTTNATNNLTHCSLNRGDNDKIERVGQWGKRRKKTMFCWRGVGSHVRTSKLGGYFPLLYFFSFFIQSSKFRQHLWPGWGPWSDSKIGWRWRGEWRRGAWGTRG